MARTGGDAMTPLTALLCLGLTVDAGTLMQAVILPRLTLWAEPSNIIANGSAVTFWCEGTPGTQKYLLKGTGSAGTRTMQMSLESGDKAKYHIANVGPAVGGLYTCEYCDASGCLDSHNLLDVAVTGLYSKPSLLALPSLVVASEGTVTLQCGSSERFHGFYLTQEGVPHSLHLQSQTHPSGQVQALFSVGPVTPRQRWTFWCYGHFDDPMLRSHPSDPLQLLVSDVYERPSLLSLQGPIVIPGQTLTLQCRSQVGYDQFALSKEGGQKLPKNPSQQLQPGLSQADFKMGPVNSSYSGRYRCYGGHGLSPVWLEPSEPLDILVAGQVDDTPILIAQPGPRVFPGENVTLRCLSQNWMNIFLLAKEGTADPPLRIQVDNRDRLTQAEFSFYPVTSAHGGTYRCYSSHTVDPYLLSHPSNPLQLRVSEAVAPMSPAQNKFNSSSDPPLPPTYPQDYIVENLGRMLLGAVVLLLLGILLLEASLSQGRSCGPSGAEDGGKELGELQPWDLEGHRG